MKSFKLVGRGPQKVLLFHGLMGTRDAFDDMLRYANLDAFQYAVAEYRGYGHSRSEAGLLTLREVVIDAVKLVEFLGWNKFTVAGHSVGALVAQMLAVALPHRVSAIVSIAGLSAKGASPEPDSVALMQSIADSQERREALVATGTGGQYTAAVVREIVAETWNEIDGRALASYALDASHTDVQAEVQSLDVPILALAGEHDPNYGEAAARETTLRWYRCATLEVMHGAGHYPMIEMPAATVSALEQFVEAVALDAAELASRQPATPA
jgi:pimeloyl-ACP methyl ester carboxylesterase